MSYHPALGKPGDFFFHYTTREAAFERMLPELELRLSPAFRVNDPLESNPAFLTAEYGEGLAGPEIAMEVGMRLQRRRQCSKVLCLTIDALDYDGNAEIFGRGYARARMWDQYAENHQGVCLMLRRGEFHAKALAELRNRAPRSWADEVSYTQQGILENPAATLLRWPAAAGDDVVEEHVRQHLTWIFFTKLLDWQSEHEYRFVESSMDDKYSFVDIGDTLAGVILGWKFPEWQARGAIELCESVGAMTWLMHWDRARPLPVQITSG